ncbi:unnamed protein product [Alternaria sp. RS040]
MEWHHEYDAEIFVAFFSQQALGDWKTRSLEWQQSGRAGKQKKRWTTKEKEDATFAAVEAMRSEHRPIVAPQKSSTRPTTAGQIKFGTDRQARNAANKYTWNHEEARSAFEAVYVRYALELQKRRLAEYPDGRLPRIKTSDKLDILRHVTEELHTLFDDEKLPLELQRIFSLGVCVGGADESNDSHAQGSTTTKTFQTTINPKEGRRLEKIPDHYPLGYNSEGESGFSGMSSAETKSPSASELESDKQKGKGKSKATHSSSVYRAHESSPSDYEYHPGDFLTEEADRTERREQARVAERNQEAARMQMGEERTRMEATRQQPYIQSNVQPQQARVATKPISSTTSKSPATRDIRVAARKQQAAKFVNPNNYPTVAEYPPGYNSSGSSNPPNTPPITNEQAYYDMMNQDFTTHHWAVNHSGNDEIYAEPQPRDTREQSPIHRSGKTAAAGKQRAVEAHQTQPKKSTASGAAKATSNVSTTGAAKQKIRGRPRQLAQTTSDTTRQTTNVPAAGIPRRSTEAHTTASNPTAGSSTGGPTRRGTEDSASSSKTKNSKQDSKKKTTKKPSSGT